MNNKPRACVIIINKANEILLIRRQKSGRIYWVFPGGSIELGETAEVAAIREAFEELSLVVTLKDKLFSQINEGREESYFLITSYSGTVKLGNGPELYRQNEKNTYKPMWVPFQEVEKINVLPLNAKQKLMEYVRAN